MESVLVMGGTTFVSSSLAQHLIGQGYTVDILTRGLKTVDYDGFRHHLICNRKSRDEMQETLRGRKYEIIFDVSAYTRDDVEVLINSIDTSLLKKYIFCSSGGVYKPSNAVIKECFETGENPNWRDYGINKKEAEDYIKNSGLPFIIFRPTYIYGENNSLYRETYFFDRITSNKIIPMPYGKNIRTQFIYISDLVRVFESAIRNEKASKVYNVTNPVTVSWEEYIRKCGEAVGTSPRIKKIDVNQVKLDPRSYFPFRDVTYMLDIEELQKDGFYIPEISLEEGLKRAYNWYIDNKYNSSDEKMMSVVEELAK